MDPMSAMAAPSLTAPSATEAVMTASMALTPLSIIARLRVVGSERVASNAEAICCVARGEPRLRRVLAPRPSNCVSKLARVSMARLVGVPGELSAVAMALIACISTTPSALALADFTVLSARATSVPETVTASTVNDLFDVVAAPSVSATVTTTVHCPSTAMLQSIHVAYVAGPKGVAADKEETTPTYAKL